MTACFHWPCLLYTFSSRFRLFILVIPQHSYVLNFSRSKLSPIFNASPINYSYLTISIIRHWIILQIKKKKKKKRTKYFYETKKKLSLQALILITTF
jgi:hypothetical protein